MEEAEMFLINGREQSLYMPIYNEKEETGHCESYRGISLLDHMTKMYERIIDIKIERVNRKATWRGTVDERKG